jgi:hypothetical protein
MLAAILTGRPTFAVQAKPGLEQGLGTRGIATTDEAAQSQCSITLTQIDWQVA